MNDGQTQVRIEGAVLAFVLLSSVVARVVFGVAPAVHSQSWGFGRNLADQVDPRDVFIEHVEQYERAAPFVSISTGTGH